MDFIFVNVQLIIGLSVDRKFITMKTSKIYILIVIAFLALFLSSCSVIGGIFKTGMGVGIFIAAAVVVLVVILMLKAGKSHD